MRNYFAVDVGPLQDGLSYARRVGHGQFSVGGGVWGAWEPWSSFGGSIFQPMGMVGRGIFLLGPTVQALQLFSRVRLP